MFVNIASGEKKVQYLEITALKSWKEIGWINQLRKYSI
jgi:hypothetical protein